VLLEFLSSVLWVILVVLRLTTRGLLGFWSRWSVFQFRHLRYTVGY